MNKTKHLKVHVMRIYKILLFQAIILLMISNTKEIFPISLALKTENDYLSVLKHLRTLRIAIENFGSTEQKKKYEDIKVLFQNATHDCFAQNFDISYKNFFKVKEELIKLMEEIASGYLNRAKEILDSTSKYTFDIMIKYSKNSSFLKYFKKPFNPVEDIKAYKEGEYHFFYDKEYIERYLKNGYKKLENAKNLFNDTNIELIKKKMGKASHDLDYILNRYGQVISSCRLAKLYGIEIHKKIKLNQISEILIKYNLPHGHIDPIFDDRIPENYKVDANDNIRLVHSLEKKRLLESQQTK